MRAERMRSAARGRERRTRLHGQAPRMPMPGPAIACTFTLARRSARASGNDWRRREAHTISDKLADEHEAQMRHDVVAIV